ncbi:hypothetical protein [Foetidibacter luteolus]|uniref:hypothetical protein n=1 Tax=Foetidibacter luteolus TaxID=2608880 RepID=UPI00129BA9C0|nr:hypothetical protein [Foetidibacter luteolus]
MRTLNISISDIEFEKFGFNRQSFSFSDFVDILSREIARQNLNESLKLAEKYGLSGMSMDEISEEVKAVRKNAKDNN